MRELVIKAYTVEDGSTKYYKEISGIRADSKPTTGLINGSIFNEVDTGKVFFFNETASRRKASSSAIRVWR